MNIDVLKLCLVTHSSGQSVDAYLAFIQQAIEGGVTSVQLRMKHCADDALLQMGRLFKSVLDSYHIPLIINDNAHVAKALHAHLHIGPHDMSPLVAREMLGPNALIGLSIETMEELHMANQLNCIDYVAASAIFPSKTKPDCKTHWRLQGLKEFVAQSKHPVVGIGGIELENVESVIEQGACGVAVIGALHHASHPTVKAAELIKKINQTLGRK